MTKEQYIENIMQTFSRKKPFTCQCIGSDDAVLMQIGDEIVSQIGDLSSEHRVIRLDMREFDDFDSMLYAMLTAFFEDSKFSEEDTLNTREDLISAGENNEDLEDFLETVLDDLEAGSEKYNVLLILDHYDAVKSVWTSHDYGFIRVITERNFFNLLLTGEKPAGEVSELPGGSSGLYNIISVTRID